MNSLVCEGYGFENRHFAMVENSQEYRLRYWATRSSVRSFAHTAHSFACSGLLASLAPSAALTRSLARSLRSHPRSWDSEWLDGDFFCVFSIFDHSAVIPLPQNPAVFSKNGANDCECKTYGGVTRIACNRVRAQKWVRAREILVINDLIPRTLSFFFYVVLM